MRSILYMLAWMLASVPTVMAQDSAGDATLDATTEPAPERHVDLEGIVVDRTMTTFGRAFFTQFSKRWVETPHARTLVLIVTERPNARTGSLVTISYGRDVIFRGFISPTRSDIERLAGIAVWQSAQRAEMIERMKNGPGNPDLGKDEI